jgi:hypothetical protein
MNIDYVGQSMCSILLSIIKDTIGELKVSHHNPQVFDSLVLAKKQRVHTGLICDNYKDLLNNKNTIVVI